jgi:hypothetical protein
MMTGAGYLINMNDIAGPYAGIVFGKDLIIPKI